MSVSERARALFRHGPHLRSVTGAGNTGTRRHGLGATSCTIENSLYRLAVVPLAALLPARIGYGIARLRGDWRYRIDTISRQSILHNLEEILGDRLSAVERACVARDFFRHQSCDAVDVMRLAGDGRTLKRLVEVRGLEHLTAALAAGKGAIICTSHCGQNPVAFSLLGASGYPVTAVGNRVATDDPGMSRLRRIAWWYLHDRFLERHRRRPNIEPGAAGMLTAMQIVEVLRANEVVCIPIDTPLFDPRDRVRAVQVDFLGKEAFLLPGMIAIAQRTDAQVLVGVIRRLADWQHQVFEISPPIAIDGDTATAFKHCVAKVEAPIYQNLAHWGFWRTRQALVNLGLVPGEAMKAPWPL